MHDPDRCFLAALPIWAQVWRIALRPIFQPILQSIQSIGTSFPVLTGEGQHPIESRQLPNTFYIAKFATEIRNGIPGLFRRRTALSGQQIAVPVWWRLLTNWDVAETRREPFVRFFLCRRIRKRPPKRSQRGAGFYLSNRVQARFHTQPEPDYPEDVCQPQGQYCLRPSEHHSQSVCARSCSAASIVTRATSKISSGVMGQAPPFSIALRKAVAHADCPLSCFHRFIFLNPGQP